MLARPGGTAPPHKVRRYVGIPGWLEVHPTSHTAFWSWQPRLEDQPRYYQGSNILPSGNHLGHVITCPYLGHPVSRSYVWENGTGAQVTHLGLEWAGRRPGGSGPSTAMACLELLFWRVIRDLLPRRTAGEGQGCRGYSRLPISAGQRSHQWQWQLINGKMECLGRFDCY